MSARRPPLVGALHRRRGTTVRALFGKQRCAANPRHGEALASRSTHLQAVRCSVQIRTDRLTNRGESMLKKLLVALFASAFALGAYAQAPKAEPKTEAKAEANKDTKKAKSTKPKSSKKSGSTKASSTKASSTKAGSAPTEVKKDTK